MEDLQKALAEYRRTGDPKCAAKVAGMYELNGENEAAEMWYERILAIGLPVEIYMQAAKFFLKMKRYAKATDIYHLFLYDLPQEGKMQFADLLTGAGAYTYATELYEQMTPAPPTNFSYITPVGKYMDDNVSPRAQRLIALGDRYFELGQTGKAVKYYYQATKESLYACIKTGECDFLLGNYERAKKHFRYVAQTTDHPHFMVMLGECYCNQLDDPDSYERAVYWFEYALKKGSAEAYYHLGMCLQFGLGVEKDEEKAFEMYREGAKRNFDKGACLCKLGNYYYKKGDFRAALEYYEKSIATGEASAFVNIAVCAYNEKVHLFKKEQLICYLHRARAMGDRYAMELIRRKIFE